PDREIPGSSGSFADDAGGVIRTPDSGTRARERICSIGSTGLTREGENDEVVLDCSTSGRLGFDPSRPGETSTGAAVRTRHPGPLPGVDTVLCRHPEFLRFQLFFI